MSECERLGLGTVQWGMPYGVSNKAGATPVEEVGRILDRARRHGIRLLDTAALYGDAEAVLGAHDLGDFRVVTKTPRYATPDISTVQAEYLRHTFNQSLRRLGVNAVYGLLAHHADDVSAPGGVRLVEAMRELQSQGRVEKIGVSIYDAAQLKAVLTVFQPDLVQLPINVFDQRLLCDGSLERLRTLGVEVHARSIFLQGLLLMSPAELPTYFTPMRPLIERWHAACAEQDMTPIQAALAFVRDLSGIERCLVGVQIAEQLDECVADFSLGRHFDAKGLACDDPSVINPALWTLQ